VSIDRADVTDSKGFKKCGRLQEFANTSFECVHSSFGL